jgi:hypothetical protein
MKNFDGFYGITLYLSRKDAGKIFIFLDPFGGGGYGNIKLTFPLRFWNKIETDG